MSFRLITSGIWQGDTPSPILLIMSYTDAARAPESMLVLTISGRVTTPACQAWCQTRPDNLR